MAHTSHKATEVHHPRPMVHEDDAVRRRWFLVSVVVTSVVAIAGWLYFFSGQVQALAKSLPGLTASDTLKNLTNETKSFGTEAVDDFKTTLAPSAAAAVSDVQAKLQAQAELVTILDKMTVTLEAEEGEETAVESTQ